MADAALSDIRVLDLGTGVPGPYCAKLLGDYGADVIKVEDPVNGDPARQRGPFPDGVQHAEKSGLFLHLNTNKRGIALNLRSPKGQQLLKDLVKRADVLVENFPPDYMASVDLGWEELERVNQGLVMTSITPFGQHGPYRDYAAEEILVFAMSSRMHGHGQEGREPLRYAPDMVWFQTGATAALATMGAVFAQKRFGIGQQVHVSALEALVGNVDAHTQVYAMTGVRRPGRMPPAISAVSGVAPVKDGFLLMIAGGERFIRRLLEAVGQPELADDPRFSTPQGRAEHLDELDALLLPWFSERTKQEAFAELQAHGVMCAPVQTVDEVFDDPQEETRGFFQEIDHPEAGRLTYPGAPFVMDETPWAVRRPAPLLGQHNGEVFCGELGLSEGELDALRSEGVV